MSVTEAYNLETMDVNSGYILIVLGPGCVNFQVAMCTATQALFIYIYSQHVSVTKSPSSGG
jgi:hypothetical protein